MLVVLTVLAIASLAVYMGALRIDTSKPDLVFEGEMRVLSEEHFSPALWDNTSATFRERAARYQDMLQAVFLNSQLRSSLRHCSVERFQNNGSSLLVFFRLQLDRRKIPRTLLNVEETAKEILVEEVTSLRPVSFRNLLVDSGSIFIKRLFDDEGGGGFPKEPGEDPPDSNHTLEVRKGVLLKAPSSSTSTTETAESEVREAPVVEGSYTVTKLEKDKKIAPSTGSPVSSAAPEEAKSEQTITKRVGEPYSEPDVLRTSSYSDRYEHHQAPDQGSFLETMGFPEDQWRPVLPQDTLAARRRTHDVPDVSIMPPKLVSTSEEPWRPVITGTGVAEVVPLPDEEVAAREPSTSAPLFPAEDRSAVSVGKEAFKPQYHEHVPLEDKLSTISLHIMGTGSAAVDSPDVSILHTSSSGGIIVKKHRNPVENTSPLPQLPLVQHFPQLQPVLALQHGSTEEQRQGISPMKHDEDPLHHGTKVQLDLKDQAHRKEIHRNNDQRNSSQHNRGQDQYDDNPSSNLHTDDNSNERVHHRDNSSDEHRNDYNQSKGNSSFQHRHGENTSIQHGHSDSNEQVLHDRPNNNSQRADLKDQEISSEVHRSGDIIEHTQRKEDSSVYNSPIDSKHQPHSAEKISVPSNDHVRHKENSSEEHSDLKDEFGTSKNNSEQHHLDRSDVQQLNETAREDDNGKQSGSETSTFDEVTLIFKENASSTTPVAMETKSEPPATPLPLITLLPVKSYLGGPLRPRPKLPQTKDKESGIAEVVPVEVDQEIPAGVSKEAPHLISQNLNNQTETTRLNITSSANHQSHDPQLLTLESSFNSSEILPERSTTKKHSTETEMDSLSADSDQNHTISKKNVNNSQSTNSSESTTTEAQISHSNSSSSPEDTGQPTSPIAVWHAVTLVTNPSTLATETTPATIILNTDVVTSTTVEVSFGKNVTGEVHYKPAIPVPLLSPGVNHRQPKMGGWPEVSSPQRVNMNFTVSKVSMKYNVSRKTDQLTLPPTSGTTYARDASTIFTDPVVTTENGAMVHVLDVFPSTANIEEILSQAIVKELNANTERKPEDISSNVTTLPVLDDFTTLDSEVTTELPENVETSSSSEENNTRTRVESLLLGNVEKSFSGGDNGTMVMLNAISKLATVHAGANKEHRQNSTNHTEMKNSSIRAQDKNSVSIPMFPLLTKIYNKIPGHNRTKDQPASLNTSTDCPGNGSLRCGNGECISAMSRCNQLVNCDDGTDERDCSCADYLRAQFLTRKLCDGVVDCWDYSDENSCEWCSPGQFVCPNSQVCVDRQRLCDGARDCPYGDDEKQCVTVSESETGAGDFAYNSHGFLMVRKHGRWGKLCINNFETVIARSKATWEISDLGRAVCKAMTFSDFERVDRMTDVTDDGRADSGSYYELTYTTGNSSDTSPRSGLAFQLTSCPRREVIHVSCRDLECGVRPQAVNQWARIVGGGNASPGDWPWQAALYKEGEFQCGATLISASWLVSAGHCFYHALDDFWVARLGALRRGTNFPSPYEQLRPIRKIILHPGYVDSGFINDISLLRLREPVAFSDYVRPICLPRASVELRDSRLCTVVGWGQLFEVGRIFPDTLQEVQLPVISTGECRKRTLFLPLYRVTDNMFCAGFDRGGRDACLGDSGGPLMCQEPDGRWMLYGVTSNGYGCARANRPGVYTKVANYISWMETTMSQPETLASSSVQAEKTACKGHRCPLGECLAQSRVCNGFMECSDGSDEKGCWQH